MNVFDLIDDGAARGLVTSLTLFPISDGRWEAIVRGGDGEYRVAMSAVPSEAARKAVEQAEDIFS